MNLAEFEKQFHRLTDHFHLPADSSRDTIVDDWFAAVQHYHVEAFDHAVTELTRTATDRFWPALGKVLEVIKGRIGRYDRAPGACATCHGTTWIPAEPWKSNGLIYEGLRRCPDCGVPAPTDMDRPLTHRPTDLELHEYRAGRYGRDLMPEWAKAKHPDQPGNADIKAAMDELRKRLFGVSEDSA